MYLSVPLPRSESLFQKIDQQTARILRFTRNSSVITGDVMSVEKLIIHYKMYQHLI